jgi:hypothetical protein
MYRNETFCFCILGIFSAKLLHTIFIFNTSLSFSTNYQSIMTGICLSLYLFLFQTKIHLKEILGYFNVMQHFRPDLTALILNTSSIPLR